MRPLRVGLVGCGPRADTHLAAMRAAGDVQAVALCDIDPGRLAAAGDRHAVAGRYASVAEMVQSEDLDLVDIVTAPGPRLAVLEEAVAAGARHLLLEKPIGLRKADTERARALGEQAFIAVNTQYRFMPHWQRVWQLLESGALGEFRAIRCSTRTNALEQGPHVLDLALEAARCAGGSRPDWILAGSAGTEMFADVSIPADLTAVIGLGEARMCWQQGPCAPAVSGEAVFWFQIQVEIVGSRGRIWVSLNQGWEIEIDGSRERGPTSWPADDEVAQPALFAELARRIDDGTTLEFPTAIARAGEVADLIFAGFESAKTGARIELR